MLGCRQRTISWVKLGVTGVGVGVMGEDPYKMSGFALSSRLQTLTQHTIACAGVESVRLQLQGPKLPFSPHGRQSLTADSPRSRNKK